MAQPPTTLFHRLLVCFLSLLVAIDQSTVALQAQSGPNGADAQCNDGSLVFRWMGQETCLRNGGVRQRFAPLTVTSAPSPDQSTVAPQAQAGRNGADAQGNEGRLVFRWNDQEPGRSNGEVRVHNALPLMARSNDDQQGSASLVIQTDIPGVHVFLDREFVGTTWSTGPNVYELRVEDVKVGTTYLVELRADNFETQKRSILVFGGLNFRRYAMRETTPDVGKSSTNSAKTNPGASQSQPEDSKAEKAKWWEVALLGAVIAAGGYAAYQAGKAGSFASSTPSTALNGASIPVGRRVLIFGGTAGTVFLGCLNCSSFDTESLHNKHGEYGNQYSSSSLFNRYGDYASRSSDVGACNPYARNPPRLVDDAGQFYGLLTSSSVLPNRTRLKEAVGLLSVICN